MHCDNDDAVFRLEVDVDEQQPAPWAEHEPKAVPSALECSAHPGELPETAQRSRDAAARTGGQAVGDDHALEILERRRGQFDRRHLLQLVDGDRLSCVRLAQPELCALVRAVDTVQERDDIARIGIGVIQGLCEQRARNGARLDVHALSQAQELLRLFVVQRDVHPLDTRSLHVPTRAVQTLTEARRHRRHGLENPLAGTQCARSSAVRRQSGDIRAAAQPTTRSL